MPASTRGPWTLTIIAWLAAGCASAPSRRVPRVVPPRAVATASGAPRILAIEDIGVGRVPRRGTLRRGPSDGQGTIGERLLIWGKSFGKQPAVTVGGEPTDVLGHVAGGGIVVRVPWGIRVGRVGVRVRTRRGAYQKMFPVRRVGLVVDGTGLELFQIGKDATIQRKGRLDLAGASRLAISPDGAVAYVASGRGGRLRLHTIDLSAQPARVLRVDALTGREVRAVLRATRADRVTVLTDSHVIHVDTSAATSPALYRAHRLPPAVQGHRGGALSPDGRQLAVLLPSSNSVALFNVHEPTRLPPPRQRVVIAARLPLLRACAFALDGRTLWVVAGDNALSVAAGKQPIGLVGLPLAKEDKPAQRFELAPRGAPRALVVGRSEPTPPGTAIQGEIPSSALYVTSLPSELLSDGISATRGGRVLRLLPGRSARIVASGRWLVGDVDIVGAAQVFAALGVRRRGDRVERILITRTAWGEGPANITSLGGRVALRLPLSLGEVRLQP